jgi:hypothetical protein
MRPRFIIVNVALAVFVIALAAIGLFAPFPGLMLNEKLVIGVLVIGMIAGLSFGFAGRWEDAQTIAIALPMVGMVFTGLTFMNAFAGLTSLAPDAILNSIRQMGFALAPNFVAIGGLAWITLSGWFAARVQI